MTIGRIPSVEGGIQPTIVDAKGDLIAGVAADSVNRLAVGTNGTVLTADSSTSTGLIWTGVNQMANPVINGGFDIWQRGTSFAINNIYTADRWVAVRGSNVAGMTVSRQTTGDTTNLPNIQYAARMQRDSGNTSTNTINMGQWFESVNSIPYAGKTVTLSFYARKGANYSAASDVLNVKLQSGTGTDQNGYSSYTGLADVITVNATLTSTWQRFAGSGTIGATATEIGVNTFYTPVGTAGANDWVEVTGVQIDLGTYTASTAPTFRRSGGTIQGELAACQRYYFRSTAANSAYAAFAHGFAESTTVYWAYLKTPISMRTKPSALEYGGTLGISTNAADIAPSAITLDQANPEMGVLRCTATGLTANRPYSLRATNDTAAYVALTAEL